MTVSYTRKLPGVGPSELYLYELPLQRVRQSHMLSNYSEAVDLGCLGSGTNIDTSPMS